MKDARIGRERGPKTAETTTDLRTIKPLLFLCDHGLKKRKTCCKFLSGRKGPNREIFLGERFFWFQAKAGPHPGLPKFRTVVCPEAKIFGRFPRFKGTEKTKNRDFPKLVSNVYNYILVQS